MLCVVLLILEIVVAFFVVRYFMHHKEGLTHQSPNLEVVIARYEEDLSWVKEEIPSSLYSMLYIYNKGSNFTNFEIPKSKVITLPNVGRESHTYLTHVVKHYDTLPDLTLFLPGSCKTNEEKTNQFHTLLEHLKTNTTSAIICVNDPDHVNEVNNFSIDYYEATSPENSQKNPQAHIEPSKERPMHKWFYKHFGNEKVNCVSYKGIILASRTDIKKRPKEFYQNLIKELSSPNPEVVHYTERTWKHIFSIEDKNCIT